MDTYVHTYICICTTVSGYGDDTVVYAYRVCACKRGEIDSTGTGWRRLIGCLKLQIIFCKRATDYRALLRKMIRKDKASYGSLPPCTNTSTQYMNTHYIYIHVHIYIYTCVYSLRLLRQAAQMCRLRVWGMLSIRCRIALLHMVSIPLVILDRGSGGGSGERGKGGGLKNMRSFTTEWRERNANMRDTNENLSL